MAKVDIFRFGNSRMDGIDSVKKAQAFKVFTYASSENEKNKAITAAYKLDE